ncbi:MAG: MGMT family protein [Candidatus Heimdallarchaeota archaeon]
MPCHRVIKSDGSIGNFRGEAKATDEKTAMLRDEGIEVIRGKISLRTFRYKF